MKLQRCLNSLCAHILRHLHLQRRFFHSYLHMLCVHLQMQATELCGMMRLERENKRRKSSPAIQITQKAAYTWAGGGERKVERNCELLHMTSLIKIGT